MKTLGMTTTFIVAIATLTLFFLAVVKAETQNSGLIPESVPVGAQIQSVELRLDKVIVSKGQSEFLLLTIDTHGQEIVGIQVNLTYDGVTFPQTWGVKTLSFPEDWLFFTYSPEPGDFRLIAIDGSAEGVSLSGAVARINFKVASDAESGSYSVEPSLVKILTPEVDELPSTFKKGVIRLLTCGDVESSHDDLVNVSDVITLLQIIIGEIEPSPYQFFIADVGVGSTGDGVVDVGDVVTIIQHIVGLVEISGCGLP